MSTACELSEAAAKERKQQIFQQQMEAFYKRWEPRDRYDAAQFNTELMMLVRQIYADAQEPLLKHMTSIVSAYSSPLTFKKD